MPDEIDILLNSAEARHGYSGWIQTPSGISVHTSLEAIAETLVATAENRVGYSGWILTPSGRNIPSIDEVIVGVPELEETLTCVGTAIHTLVEQIVGTPEPVPIEPISTGGGTYAPIFEQDVLVAIEEELTNISFLSVATSDEIVVEDVLVYVSRHIPTFEAWYRKEQFIAYPVLPEIDIPPKVVHQTPRFPDETFSGMTSDKRKAIQQKLLLLDII